MQQPVKGTIPLDDISEIQYDPSKRDPSLVLVCLQRNYEFRAEHESDFDVWSNLLEEAWLKARAKAQRPASSFLEGKTKRTSFRRLTSAPDHDAALKARSSEGSTQYSTPLPDDLSEARATLTGSLAAVEEVDEDVDIATTTMDED